MHLLFALALGLLQLYLLVFAVFLYAPMAGALLDRWLPRAGRRSPASAPGKLAVLIAAHNEQAVIAQSLVALQAQRYPREAYDVFVVADNCRDQTAEIARSAGARVYARKTSGPSTKGQALRDLWQRIPGRDYAGVVVLDADNQADPGFLAAIASELTTGVGAVQGLRRAKNDDENGIAGLDALTELCTHRIGAAGRRYFGLNGPLMGSGVAYQTALFDRLINQVGQTVVEDCEWMAVLALEGTVIHWTPRAIVYDQKTAHAAALKTQRDRWMAGRGEVARAYTGPLLWSFVRTGSLSALDAAVFLQSPPRVLTLAGFGLCWLLALAHAPGAWASAIWFGCLALFALYVSLGLYLDGAPPRAYLALLKQAMCLPGFALQMARSSWKALTGARVAWVPTPHGRP